MRLMYFNDFRLGVLKGDRVVDVTTVVANIPHTGPGDLMNGLIANFANFRSRLQDAVAKGDGPTVAVHARIGIRDAQLAQGGDALGGEGLIQLDHVEIGLFQPQPVHQLLRCGRRADPHDARRHRSTRFTHHRAPSSAMVTPWCCQTSRPPSLKVKRNWRL